MKIYKGYTAELPGRLKERSSDANKEITESVKSIIDEVRQER